jgi:hypothetical protein
VKKGPGGGALDSPGAPLLVGGGDQQESTMKWKLSKKAIAAALAIVALAGVG